MRYICSVQGVLFNLFYGDCSNIPNKTDITFFNYLILFNIFLWPASLIFYIPYYPLIQGFLRNYYISFPVHLMHPHYMELSLLILSNEVLLFRYHPVTLCDREKIFFH